VLTTSRHREKARRHIVVTPCSPADCRHGNAEFRSDGAECCGRQTAPQQSEWQDLEFGVIIHFGTNTFLDREWGDGKATSEIFAPMELDPDQWMPAHKFGAAIRERYIKNLIAKERIHP
jgi:hypothetical protein